MRQQETCEGCQLFITGCPQTPPPMSHAACPEFAPTLLCRQVRALERIAALDAVLRPMLQGALERLLGDM
jgi:hypothetical protein